MAITLGDAALAASTLIGAMSALSQGQAQRAAGANQARVADYNAQLRNRQAAAMEQQAGQERAVSQRHALAERKKGELVSSRATAVAAASGAGALDPTIVDIQASIDQEADTRAMSALYTGEERARGLEYGATLERAGGAGDVYAGQAAQRAGEAAQSRSYLSAGATLFQGASRFGGKSRGLSRYSLDTPFGQESYG